MPLHRRLPKRGFNKPFPLKLNEVNLDRVQQAIDAGKLDISGAPSTPPPWSRPACCAARTTACACSAWAN